MAVTTAAAVAAAAVPMAAAPPLGATVAFDGKYDDHPDGEEGNNHPNPAGYSNGIVKLVHAATSGERSHLQRANQQ